jgi:hypothetical protein
VGLITPLCCVSWDYTCIAGTCAGACIANLYHRCLYPLASGRASQVPVSLAPVSQVSLAPPYHRYRACIATPVSLVSQVPCITGALYHGYPLAPVSQVSQVPVAPVSQVSQGPVSQASVTADAGIHGSVVSQNNGSVVSANNGFCSFWEQRVCRKLVFKEW